MENKNVFITKGNFIVLFSCLLFMFYQPIFAINPIDQSLFSAVSRGSIQEVEQAIHNGANVNSQDQNRDSALALALRRGHFDILQLLINKAISLDVPLHDGNTLLTLIAQIGHIEIAQLLIIKRPDIINCTNNSGKAPLHYAAHNGYSELAQLLLKAGADVNASNYGCPIPLHLAAENGRTEVVKILLDSGAYVNARNYKKETPLHLAAFNGHSEVVKLLLNPTRSNNLISALYKRICTKNANINAADQDGMTPLHRAAQKGHSEIVKILLHKEANINAVAYYTKQTPLHLAIQNGHTEVVRVLLKQTSSKHLISNLHQRRFAEKLNINAVGQYSMTPLCLAVSNNNSKIVELLLDAGANIDFADTVNSPALHMALLSWNKEMINILLNKGVNLEVLNTDHETALHLAALQGWIEGVQLLLERGAQVDALNADNNTALHLVAARAHNKVVDLLLEKGAHVHALNQENQTPVSCAFDACIMFDPSSGELLRINIIGVNTFIKLLLWYFYQKSKAIINNHETHISQSIENLIRRIKEADLSLLSAYQAEYFNHARSLSFWIITQTASCQSEKEFLEKILNYLLGSNPVEQQNILKENIKHLLLNNYLLNKENSDYYDLKANFSSIKLQKLKELENWLRVTYAQQLKKELFHNISKEDLENNLNALKKPENDLTVLGKIGNLRNIKNPVTQYSNNSSIKGPLKESILEMDTAIRMYEFTQWIQKLHDQTLASSAKESVSKTGSSSKAVWSTWGVPYLKNLQQLVNNIYNYLGSMMQDPHITPFIQWIEEDYNNYVLVTAQKDFPKKGLTSKAMWSTWGVSYLEDSKRLLINIYNHLQHIIDEEGTCLNSNTQFGRDRIDILQFDKKNIPEAS